MERAKYAGEAAARADLGTPRSKPAWLENQHSLPFQFLSPDEFEIFCYLLLCRENPGENICYYGKTGDAGRDIVRIKDNGSVEVIQCKHYQRNVDKGEIRTEIAKLYVNIHSQIIPKFPDKVIFYVVPDLTAPAQDLINHHAKWLEIAESALKEYLKKEPTSELLDFALSWHPLFSKETAIDLTQRAWKHKELVYEFFSVKKVVESDVVEQKLNLIIEQNNASSQVIEQLASDNFTVRLRRIYELERIGRNSKSNLWWIMEFLTTFLREVSSKQKIPTPAGEIQAALTVLKRLTHIYAQTEEQKLDLRGVYLCEADLQGAILQSIDFREAKLQEVNLQKADLRGAYFHRADLQGTQLTDAKLTGAVFMEANLRGVNLQRADLRKAILYGADLQGKKLQVSKGYGLQLSVLREANLQGADFSCAKLCRARFQKANLGMVNFRSANLSKADLQETSLQKANLYGADLQGANLQGADLSRANLRNTDLRNSNLQKASLLDALYDEKTQFPKNFNPINAGVRLIAPNVSLFGQNLKDSNLEGADLEGANLQEANLQSANLRWTNLKFTNLERANLQGTNLTGATLYGAKAIIANLENACLCGTTLPDGTVSNRDCPY